MQIDMNRFRAAFYEEAGEHLENMEGALLQLESASEDSELLNTIFRAAHSIKGASSTFGIDQVAKFTHVLENLLDRMRDGQVTVTSELVQLLLNSTDILAALIDAEQNQSDPPADVERVLDALKHFNSGATPPDTPPRHEESCETNGSVTTQGSAVSDGLRSYQVDFVPSESFFLFGQNPLFLLADLKTLSEDFDVQARTEKLPSINEIDPEKCYLSWNISLSTRHAVSELEDVFMFVDDGTQFTIRETGTLESGSGAKAESDTENATEIKDGSNNPSATDEKLSNPPEATTEAANDNQTLIERRSGNDRRAESPRSAPVARETVRVDRERLDKMINQIGELVIGTSMVEQDWHHANADEESTALVQLGKIVCDLQEMSLSLRMVPIAASFQKMARVIRDLSLKLGKQIHMETEGEETELDKTVVDQIGDPLLHMVRNSVDHGIESPEVRTASGKPAEGKITLKAYHQGGNFIIEIQDDGKGLDRDRILSKAIERGIVSDGDGMSNEEIYGLIFAAGFSTAEQVTDVSGRGVGMDVVRRNVEALQGSITIRSQKGQGCRMIVRLPLTLAILDGLLVRVSKDSYVIPLLSVVESIKPEGNEIQSIMGKGEVIKLRGEIVPLLRPERILNLHRHEARSEDGLLVIVEDQGRKYAMVVDELLGQQQVVIKNLEVNFQKVPGVAGATILGDGRVALILDINGLCGLVGRQVSTAATSPVADALTGIENKSPKPDLLSDSDLQSSTDS